MIDPLDCKTIELDALMCEGLWYDGTEATLIKETKNEKVYQLKDGTIVVKRHIGEIDDDD